MSVISLCFPFAQEKTIEVTGVVTDMNKEPLVGVNVTVKDKPGLGAITDINGRYKINIEEFSRLVFSYIGFDTQEILVKHQNLVNVSMKESEAREIDEVVITGTGAQKKLTVTGAVTNVDVEVLKSILRRIFLMHWPEMYQVSLPCKLPDNRV